MKKSDFCSAECRRKDLRNMRTVTTSENRASRREWTLRRRSEGGCVACNEVLSPMTLVTRVTPSWDCERVVAYIPRPAGWSQFATMSDVACLP